MFIAAQRNATRYSSSRDGGAHSVPDAIEARWGHPVAYLNSGSALSPCLVPPGNSTFLSANFRVS
jgi:hypothetical protein